MSITKLRQVGGSIMLSIPRQLLKQVNLNVGSTVNIAVERDHLLITGRNKPVYTLQQLLAQCDKQQTLSAEEKSWLELDDAGDEEIK